MTITEIVVQYLKTNGFDGLYNDEECGCALDDLMPCGGEGCSHCEPGYHGPDPSGESDYLLCPDKPKCLSGGDDHCAKCEVSLAGKPRWVFAGASWCEVCWRQLCPQDVQQPASKEE